LIFIQRLWHVSVYYIIYFEEDAMISLVIDKYSYKYIWHFL